MDKEIAKINKIAGSLLISLELDEESLKKQEIQSKDDFHDAITKLVRAMIENDFERFLSIMYRMDVSEIKLKKALNTPNPDEVYSKIAELIISREEEKIFWREKYKD